MKKLIICAVILFGFLVFGGCGRSGNVTSPTPDSSPVVPSAETSDEAPGISNSPDASPDTSSPSPGTTPDAPSATPDSSPTPNAPNTAPASPDTPSPTPGSADVSPDNSGGKRDAIPFEAEQLYAAAYLGYQSIDDLNYYAERYLDSDNIPVHYVSDGDFYLVIPRYNGMSLSLYVNDIETSLGELRFRDPDCGPFIIQCNVSDIFADATLRLEYKGETVEFSPYISLKDGSVMIGERGLDLTKPDTVG